MRLDRYRPELLLALASAGAVAGISAFQSARKLSQADVDRYIGILERDLPPELEDREEFISRLRAWAEDDDGRPVYMLNLMRFFDQLRPFPGAPVSGTPKDANAHYETSVVPMLLRRGGYPILAGSVTKISAAKAGGGQDRASNLMVYRPDLDDWDRVLVVRYPGRRTFLDLVTDPRYLEVMPYKLSSLEVVLTPVSGQLVIPDARWIAGAAGLANLLLAGWIRTAWNTWSTRGTGGTRRRRPRR
jgi:hypothetical protein